MTAQVGDERPEYADIPFCEHLDCHDRVHGDPVHTDEHGRPFTGATPDWPDHEPAQVDDEDQALDDEPEPPARREAGEHRAVDEPVTEPPAPQPFPLTPIYDQLVAEQHHRQERP